MARRYPLILPISSARKQSIRKQGREVEKDRGRERKGFQLVVAEPGKGSGVQARVSDLPWMSFGLSGRLLTPCCR